MVCIRWKRLPWTLARSRQQLWPCSTTGSVKPIIFVLDQYDLFYDCSSSSSSGRICSLFHQTMLSLNFSSIQALVFKSNWGIPERKWVTFSSSGFSKLWICTVFYTQVDRRLKTVCEQFISSTSTTMLHLVTDLNSRMAAFVKVIWSALDVIRRCDLLNIVFYLCWNYPIDVWPLFKAKSGRLAGQPWADPAAVQVQHIFWCWLFSPP